MIPSGDVVVVNDRITAVGPSGRVAIPAGADDDVSGKTIIPGYVDIHAHMYALAQDAGAAVLREPGGVTTACDPQTSSSDVTYADACRRRDHRLRYLSTGPGVFSRDEVRSLVSLRTPARYGTDFWNTQTPAIRRGDAALGNTSSWRRGARPTPTIEGAGDFKMSISEMIDGYAGTSTRTRYRRPMATSRSSRQSAASRTRRR